MAKGTNPKSIKNLKPFKKGEPSGNPLGGKLHNPEIKKIKALTEKELIEVGTFIVQGKMGELKALLKNPETPMLQAMVAGLAVKTMVKGDASAFNALMDRLLGKVKEQVQLSGSINGNAKLILTMPDNGRSKKTDE